MDKTEGENQMESMSVLYLEKDKVKRLHYTKILKEITSKIHVCLDEDELVKEYARLYPDVVITDIGLEGSAQFNNMKALRDLDETLFILVISEHKEVEYLQVAIELDVCSYLIKPVSKEQLSLAFEKVMQRCCKQKDKKSVYLEDDLYYQANIRSLIRGGSQINLNKKEARLLEYFLESKNILLSYAEIKKHIWPGLDVSSASLRTLIKNLRKKGMADLIQNISGSGYLLQVS